MKLQEDVRRENKRKTEGKEEKEREKERVHVTKDSAEKKGAHRARGEGTKLGCCRKTHC